MRCKTTLALLAAMAVCAPLAGAQSAGGPDWPQWRGPNANGISPEKGINKAWNTRAPALLWKVPMHDDGFAGPSVAAGKVFIIDHSGSEDIVRAFNLASGQEVWHFNYPDTNQANYGFCRATPVYNEGKLYTMSRLGLLHCLNPETGAVIWARDVIKEFGGKRPNWDIALSPLIDGDRLVTCVGSPNGSVVVLDKNTGKTIMQGGGPEVSGYATPVVATINGVKQYVLFMAKNIIGVNASNLNVLWYHPFVTDYDVNAATPLVIGNAVFVTGGYGHGCVMLDITPNGPKVRWESKAVQAHFASPVFTQGYIYATGDPGILTCLDPATGRQVWKQDGFEKGQISVADGTIIGINGAAGDVIMAKLTPGVYQELGRIKPLGGQSWTAPIIAQGRLIVRNKSALACLNLK